MAQLVQHQKATEPEGSVSMRPYGANKLHGKELAGSRGSAEQII